MKVLRIRHQRIQNEWTQEYVGKYAGITKAAIHDIETGRRKPSYDVLVKLEDLFNLTHRQLFAAADGANHNLSTE